MWPYIPTDSDAMKAQVLANVENAFRNQKEKLQVYNVGAEKNEEQEDLQESCTIISYLGCTHHVPVDSSS